MILTPSGARVWLAAGHTDMRKGFDGLALLVQETLKRDPHSGQLFVFRGRRGGLIKVLWHDGQGLCLFAKRLERGLASRARDGAEHRRRFPFCYLTGLAAAPVAVALERGQGRR
jgi:transposase